MFEKAPLGSGYGLFFPLAKANGQYKTLPRKAAFHIRLKLLVAVLALLVGNAARGLASGLARGLALAAAAVLSALAEILGFDRLDVLHNNTSVK